MKRGNQALKADPKGVKFIFLPRNIENVVSRSSSIGGARSVVKLYVRGILLLDGVLWSGTLSDKGRKHKIRLILGQCGGASNYTYSRSSSA